MAPNVEKVAERFQLGEGPFWDAKKQCLYFCSMTEHKILRYVPSTKKLTAARIGNHNVSIIIPVKGKEDQFVITVDSDVAIVKWDGESEQIESLKKIYLTNEADGNVFNDGKCDPKGRLWAGTIGHVADSLDVIPDGEGTLYSFNNGEITSHRTEIGVANGISFDVERKKMYYIDSFKFRVDQFDFDVEKGVISNHEVIFSIETLGLKTFCLFDGMTIDTDGYLWIAVFAASRVIKIDPRTPETLLETILFPAKQITSVAFGGADLDELYVTSGRVTGKKLPEPLTDEDGALYRVTGLNAKGLPANEFVF